MRYRVPRPQVARRMRCPRLLLGMLCCCLLLLLAACGSPAGAQRNPASPPQPTATATPVGPTLKTVLLTYTGHGKAVIGVAWSPDGKHIASCGVDGSVQVWDAHNGKSLLTYTGHSDSVERVAWSPDGRRIASASYDQTVQVWDAQSGKTLLTGERLTLPTGPRSARPGGRSLASVRPGRVLQPSESSGDDAMRM